MRLDKYLADMGLGTRTELKKIIKSGRVTVDGSVAKDPGTRVTDASVVSLDGSQIRYEEFVYYMLNKPAGIISASEDPREQTVVDLIEENSRRGLFPVGRLDRDTEGLLLITNDGALAHRLLSPKHHVDKTYYARVRGIITDADVQAFADGLTLPDGLKCMPAGLKILAVKNSPESEFPSIKSGSEDLSSETESEILSEVLVTIREGKFHQIKRMFQAIGSEVLYLRRLSMGPLSLDESLSTGEYRRLTEDEVNLLREV